MTLSMQYVGGDVVERGGRVYRCQPWPRSGRCNQAGYEPGDSLHWMEAWTVEGSCTGTIPPTLAPTILEWERIGCPEEYEGSATYEEDSTVSKNEVVYRCKPHPDTGFCNTHSPDSWWGFLGWEKLGACAGTLPPTYAPTELPTDLPTTGPTYALWALAGCPEPFDESLGTTYFIGNVTESGGVVYECTEGPRCNQAGWEPGIGEYWEWSWVVLGSCTGTLTLGDHPASFSRCSAPAYDGSTAYEEGDLVQAGGVIYSCKPYPSMLWCGNPDYMPGTKNGAEAWDTVGPC